MVRAGKYMDSAVNAIKKISSRISKYSVKQKINLLAWGQHIDDQAKGQIGLYGTSGAIEIIDKIDSDENTDSTHYRTISDDLKKGVDFLTKFVASEGATTTEGPVRHQLTLLPKLLMVS